MKNIAILSLPGRGARDEFIPLRANPSLNAHWVRLGNVRKLPTDKAVDKTDRRWHDFPHYSEVFPNGIDVIVIPGSRLTMADLQYLRESDGERILREHLAAEGTVVGVCGGYQILGEALHDPLQKQGGEKSGQGFNLLPIVTLFGPKLINCVTTAECLVAPGEFRRVGGEEHRSGFSWDTACAPFFHRLNRVTTREFTKERPAADSSLMAGVNWNPGDEQFDGFVSKDRRVWGTYIHKIFHHEPFCRAVLTAR